MMTRGIRFGVGSLLLASGVLLTTVACSKKEEEKAAEKKEESKPKKPTGDRYADGKRLAKELEEWGKRWPAAPELPACEPVLKKPEELALCKAAQTAQTALVALVAKNEKPEVLAHAAGELALASERVLDVVRPLALAQVAAAPADPKVVVPTPVKPTTPPKAAPAGSAKPTDAKPTEAKPGEDKPNPDAPDETPERVLVRSYTRVNRLSLRFLGRLLQVSPLATRSAVAQELETIGKGQEDWSALGRTLGDAARSENDPALKTKLRELTGHFAKPPLSERMPPGHPASRSGHPGTLQRPGAPPAPAGSAPAPAPKP